MTCLRAFCQHPIGSDSMQLQTLGSSNTLVKSKAAIGSDSGFVNAVYPDTASANFGKIKNYPGAQIRTGDTVWIRNFTATKWLFLSPGISSGTLFSLGPIGSAPNANGMTLSSSVLNLEPASRSFGGVVTANNSPQYFQGQKGVFSNTDTIFTWYGNEVLRSRLISLGIQRWWLNDGVHEVGSISFSTPLGEYQSGSLTGSPGIHYNDINGLSRSQMRLLSGGGLSFGSMDSLTTGIPGSQMMIKSNGKVIVTGRVGDYTGGEPYIVDSTEQGLFNVYGSIRSTDLIGIGNRSVEATSDGKLVIGSGITASPLTFENILDNGSDVTHDHTVNGNNNNFLWSNFNSITIDADNFNLSNLLNGDATHQYLTTDAAGKVYLKPIELPIDSFGFTGTQDYQSTLDYGSTYRHPNTIHISKFDSYVDSIGNYSSFAGNATFDDQTGDYTEHHQDSTDVYMYSQRGLNFTETRVSPDSTHHEAGDSLGNNAYVSTYSKGTNRIYATGSDSLDAPVINFPKHHNPDSTKYQANINNSGDLYYTLKSKGDTSGVTNALSWGVGSGGDITQYFINMIQSSFTRFYIPAGDYWISVSALKAASQTNHQGIVLKSNIEIFGDGSATRIHALGNLTGDTSNTNYYPMFNGFNAPSNVRIHDLMLDGNKDSFAIYNPNPYLNPTGHDDTSRHKSIQGIYVKQGDNIKTWNVWVDSCQGFGIEAYNSTSFNVDNCKLTDNGNGGVGYTSNSATVGGSTGILSNSLLDANNSDNVRIINGIGLVTVTNCRISNARYYIGATNWFAGVFVSARNVILRGNKVFGNSAYGFDVSYNSGLGDTTTNRGIIVDGNVIYNNANAGIAVSMNKAVITNNQIYNNGKTQGGLIDTASASYDPAAIVGNNATDAVIENNVAYDTAATPIQIWFIKKYASTPTATWSFRNSSINNNRISNIADTAHAYQGNNGSNNIIYNVITTTSGNLVPPAADSLVLGLVNAVPTWIPRSSGSSTITSTQIGYGSVANALTSDVYFTRSATTVTIRDSAIGTTNVVGLDLQSANASAGATNQYSPSIKLNTNFWNSSNKPNYILLRAESVSDFVNKLVIYNSGTTFPLLSLDGSGNAIFSGPSAPTMQMKGITSIGITTPTNAQALLISTPSAGVASLTAGINISNLSSTNTANGTYGGLVSTFSLPTNLTAPNSSSTWSGANFTISSNASASGPRTSMPASINGVFATVNFGDTSMAEPKIIGMGNVINLAVTGSGPKNITLGYGFYTGVTDLNSAGTKFGTYKSSFLDTVPSSLIATNGYGIYQASSNLPNFTSGAFLIGYNGSSTPALSSSKILFQVQGDRTKGSIPAPRMTNTERDAISSPDEGLQIYSTTDHAYEYYNGTSWKQFQPL